MNWAIDRAVVLRRLKQQFERELKVARSTRVERRIESRTERRPRTQEAVEHLAGEAVGRERNVGAFRRKHRMIEDVEHIRFEAQVDALTDGELTLQREIQLAERKTADE